MIEMLEMLLFWCWRRRPEMLEMVRKARLRNVIPQILLEAIGVLTLSTQELLNTPSSRPASSLSGSPALSISKQIAAARVAIHPPRVDPTRLHHNRVPEPLWLAKSKHFQAKSCCASGHRPSSRPCCLPAACRRSFAGPSLGGEI